MIQQLTEIRNNILSALEQNDNILAKKAINDLDTLLHDLSNQQEEPKQELGKELFELEQELDIPSSMRRHNSRPKQLENELRAKFPANIEGSKEFNEANKQETLKEPKKSFGEIWSTLTEEQSEYLKGYIDKQVENAKKWQQEKMYSEEECYRKLHNLMTDIKIFGVVINDDTDLKKWFDKKK